MKHVLLMLAVSFASLIGCSSAIQPPPTEPPPSSSNVFLGAPGVTRNPQGLDLDCADFASQDEAQDFFEASGGVNKDPHQLDADNDGIACERDERWGTGGTGGSTVTPPTVTPPSPPTVTPPAPPTSGQCWVNGYYRKDGTYVRGYWRRC